MMDAFYSFLGLAVRAGKVKTGDETVLHEIRKRSLSLVIVAGDASPNTKKKFKDKSSYYQVPLYITGNRASLGGAIGKDSRVVIGISDNGFAKKLISMLDE
ncbi:YlxQ family RNA-binding protein [Salibacterium salarium]|uniref:YlxQ family RNA-binding protein n=1 Tax=Salibacterium salarium TaxID=284579 RepID=A0A3R9P9A4_9BACI|nr:YlxQ family RNA-binding protein [Salibacterium salarium]RSL33207.1 YlxQ family RNA-binding protein [Salibacterium salarium]